MLAIVFPFVEPGRVVRLPMGTWDVEGPSFHVVDDDATVNLMRLLSTTSSVEAYTEESI